MFNIRKLVENVEKMKRLTDPEHGLLLNDEHFRLSGFEGSIYLDGSASITIQTIEESDKSDGLELILETGNGVDHPNHNSVVNFYQQASYCGVLGKAKELNDVVVELNKRITNQIRKEQKAQNNFFSAFDVQLTTEIKE